MFDHANVTQKHMDKLKVYLYHYTLLSKDKKNIHDTENDNTYKVSFTLSCTVNDILGTYRIMS